ITHDQPSAGDPQPTTADRVGLVAGLNLPTDDPHLAGLIMARTVADAEVIKQLAGTSSRGRRLKAPFIHLSLSWSPDELRPDRAEMLRAVEEALKSIGLGACQALVVEHTDTAHPHVHVVVCRVDPETGKACGRKNDARKLSTWAAKYERSRGRVQVPNRIARSQAREEYRAVVDVQVGDRVPIDEAKKKARDVVPLPPMQAKRGAGRAARTPAERQDWTAHFKARVQSPTPPDQARRERVRLARTHRRRRRRQKVLAPLTKLKLLKRAPDATLGRTESTTKATTARISGPDLQRLEAQVSAKRDRISDELGDAEVAVRKAERGVPRRQRTSAPASTTRERQARATFEAAVRDDRAAQRTLRAAGRDHAAARDALAGATRTASRWTPNRQRGSEQRRAYLDADNRYDQARDAELAAEVQARWNARSRQEARDRWRASATDKLRDRQDRRRKARENRPARRRLRRLRQHVADLRQRLTTLGTALKVVERVLERLGLSKPPPAPAPPPPDLGPSLSSIMRDLDRHVERDYPAPVPEPVRAGKPERVPSSRTPPAPGVRHQPPARERPPAAAPAGSREAGPKPQLAQILIGAVCAGGARLSRVRSEFERMDAGKGVKRLVLQVVDPELLEAVVGPQLAPAWVKPLRAQYARFKQAYPADWVDVEKGWRKQRERWRSKAAPHREEPHREQPATRAVPPRAPGPAVGAADKAQQQRPGHDR
ncbi:MAG: relaxase/mobilization nuclease domain-containing protein, partial [Acidobacteria bacterium]|nr:relaxase/mobilization nuclease domain-containing protein [Acidobacteriota bacterium]